MCGIVGTLSFKPGLHVSSESIDRMRDTLAHRGPDGAGTWIDPDRRVGLGHRRLSIIDLSHAADQPMVSSNGQHVLVFNGEIYNHAELRRELTRLGVADWTTDHSDTEVILKAYAHWGRECLAHFRGMFAFALWDGRLNQLWLVRDRIGIKPLYVSHQQGWLAFASEIKALLAAPDQPKRLNERALYHYLSFLTTPGPETMFEGIVKLAPGTQWIVHADGKIDALRYWDAGDEVLDLNGHSPEDLHEMLREQFDEAVRLRGVSDVPVGVFLSGGVDSSANALRFSRHQPGRIKTFTIGYAEEHSSYQNEFGYARQVADLLQTEHHEMRLTQNDLIDFLPTMVELQDEPIADPVCVPVYFCSKLARDNGVKVCQLGEGADELFFGYQHWRESLRLQRLADLPFTSLAKRLLLARERGRTDSWLQGFRSEYLMRSLAAHPLFWGGAEAFSDSAKRALVKRPPSPEDALVSWEAIAPIRQRFEQGDLDKTTMNWMSYLDLNLRLPELLLMRVDKMSMGVSLEARVPFLDHKFVTFGLSLPGSMKLRGSEGKAILKQAFVGQLPDEILFRKKQGFGVPVTEWIFSDLGRKITDDIGRMNKQSELFNADEIDLLLKSGPAKRIWFVHNFALWWLRHFG